MGEGQSPQAQVGCCMGNAIETKFYSALVNCFLKEGLMLTNSVDRLVDHDF